MKFDKTIGLYYLANFTVSLQFILPVWLIFYTVNAGFSVTQAMILGTIGYFVSNILEIPTGVVADKYSPKVSYSIGSILVFLASLFYFLTPNFWLFLFAEFIFGFGFALLSGCLESLIFEYLKESKQESAYPKITSNRQSVLFIGRIVGSLSSAVIFLINPILPFILIGITHLLSLIFVLNIKVAKIPQIENTSKDILLKSFKKIQEVLRIYPLSGLLLVIIFIQTVFMDFYFYSYPLLIKDLNLSFELSGYVFAFVSVFSALGSQIFQKYLKNRDLVLIQVLCVSVVLLTILIAVGSVWAFVIALMVQGICGGLIYPAFNTFWQPKIEKEYRTTLISTFSFVLGVLSALSALIAGLVIDNFGIGAMKMGLLVMMLVVTVPFLIWLRVVLRGSKRSI
jgi:MFS family permease